MKVITLIQPWATLIAMGEKKFETRSWSTKHRGDLLIHAGKKVDKFICQLAPFNAVLAKHGLKADTLPTGVIIAKSFLSHCYEVTSNHGHTALLEGGDVVIESNEIYFGDYSEGRFVWELKDVEQIRHIPAKGQLGLWNYPKGENTC